MPEHSITITAEELDRLLGRADGNAALLFLHIRAAGGFSLGRAARELKCTESELLAAAGLLRSLGLLEEPPERTETPEYTAEDLSRRAREDLGFEALVREAERCLGHVLSSNDLRLLLGLYDYWGLDLEVIMTLLHYAVDRFEAEHGPGRRPTMRYVEQEGRFWAKCEVRNLADAEDLIARQKARRSALAQTQEVLQIQGRKLTKTEREYLEQWLAWGFPPESIAIAYDRTMVSTGRLQWKYMNSILERWRTARLFSPAQIEQGDGRRGAPRPQNAPPEPRDDMDRLRRMAARMKEKQDGT